MTKKNLRHRLRLKRIQMNKQAVCENSLHIYAQLIQMPAYCSAQCIACYVSIKNEVNTQMVIQNALEQGKRVGVPVTQGNGIMNFQAITDPKELRSAQHGLQEPDTDLKKVIPPQVFDLAIVPGIAFDRHGHRIGSGGGYYDRYLSQTKAARLGLAYDFQLLEDVPIESHDLKMDWIITENESIHIT